MSTEKILLWVSVTIASIVIIVWAITDYFTDRRNIVKVRMYSNIFEPFDTITAGSDTATVIRKYPEGEFIIYEVLPLNSYLSVTWLKLKVFFNLI